MSVSLISGASSGVGCGIAKACLSLGDQVIGLCRDPNKFNPKRLEYTPLVVDFSKIDTLEGLISPVIKKLKALDLLVISAGYGYFSHLEECSIHDMQRVMNVNFLSQAILVKLCLPLLNLCF